MVPGIVAMHAACLAKSNSRRGGGGGGGGSRYFRVGLMYKGGRMLDM